MSRFTGVLASIGVALSGATWAQEDPCAGNPTEIIQVSVASDGTPGNLGGDVPSANYCGDKVAFTSSSSNFYLGDAPNSVDVFIHDTQSAETLVVAPSSLVAVPSISGDGQFVAFTFADVQTPSLWKVFLADTQSGDAKLVSVTSDGTEADGSSYGPSISGNGRYVAFLSNAPNLGSSEFYNATSAEVFVHDTQTGETKQVSAAADGTDSNSANYDPSISTDGRHVAFASRATNLDPIVNNQKINILVKDLDTGSVELVSKSTFGAQSREDSRNPSISGDGMVVAFQTSDFMISYDGPEAGFLDTNGFQDIYIHDRATDKTSRVSIASDLTEGDGDSTAASISDDGRYVAFQSKATNLVASDTNGLTDIFVHDRETGQTKRANVAADGTEASYEGIPNFGNSKDPVMSGDGRYVAFYSNANNLIETEVTGQDIYRAPNPFLESVPYVRPDPTKNFLWSGDAGDDDWHKALNWDIKATGEDATVAPGALEGVETVEIAQSAVGLSGFPAHIRSIESGGSLVVSEPLRIESSSSIENLTLDAELSTGGTLSLSGENVWNSGMISGDGSIDLQGTDSTLVIGAPSGILELGTELSVGGAATQAGGTLNLIERGIVVSSSSAESRPTASDDGAAHGSITVKEGGSYELKDGSVVTGDQPSAKFSLKNGSRLTIASPSELFEPLGTRIDAPIETTGEIYIDFRSKSKLTIAKRGNYSGETKVELGRDSSMHVDGSQTYSGTTSFLLHANTSLHFNAEQTFSGTSSISTAYEGSVIGDPVVATKGTLTILDGYLTIDTRSENPTPLFDLGGDLIVKQGQFRNHGSFLWLEGVISGGSIQNDGSLQFGLVNYGAFEMSEIVPNGGFRLEGVIENEKELIISQNLTLGDQSQLRNPASGNLRIFGDISLRGDFGANVKLLNSGTVRINNAGVVDIWIPYESKAGTLFLGRSDSDSTGYALNQRGTSEFLQDDQIIVYKNAELEFLGDLTIHGRLSFFREGSVSVKDTNALIKDGGYLEIVGGKSEQVETPYGDTLLHGSGGWQIDGGVTTIADAGYITVRDGGVFEWEKGIINHPNQQSFATIQNYGVMDITGSGSHELNGSIVNLNQLTISGAITGDGSIFGTKTGSVVVLDNPIPINIGVRFANSEKVFATSETEATFSGPVDQFGSSILGSGQLTGGKWIISDGADLNLELDGAEKNIQIIRDDAIVELRGSGNFNGLRNVVGDLDVRNGGKLTYRDVENAFVSGQLNLFESVELRMFGSRLTVTGDLEMGSNFTDLLGLPLSSTLVLDASSELIIRDQFEVLSGAIVNIEGTLRAASLDIQNGGSFGGSGRINGLLFTNAGELRPGTSPGKLTLDGDFIQTATGVLEIEVGGSTPGSGYDQLIVNGTATLGGTLRIIPLDEFSMEAIELVPLEAEVVAGAFDSIVADVTSSRSLFQASMAGTELRILSQTLSVTTYADWANGIDSPADSFLGAETSDADSDRISNLMEYALDLNPWIGNPSPIQAEFVASQSSNFDRISISFPWAKDMTDVQYVVQISSDLIIWTDVVVELENSISEGAHDLLTLGATIDSSPDNSRFVRLQIEQTADL